MFDSDSKEQYERILWYHPESDCYGICKSSNEWEHYNNCGELDDVTDTEHHEAEYKRRIEEENENATKG
jgi:hypothetical protein